MTYRRTRAVAVKEFRHILRDPRSLAMALVIPLVMLVMFGIALSLDVDRIPTLIHDQSRTPQSRALIARFTGSRFFEIHGQVSSYAAVERAIDRNQVTLGVVIPRAFGRDEAAGRDAQVQILLDGSDSNTASIALGYVDGMIGAYSLGLRLAAQDRRGAASSWPARPPVEAETRVWYNSELQSKNYVVPGLTAVVLMIIAALLTSLTIAREWESGAMEMLLATPLRPAELVLGKMSAFFAVGVLDAVIAVAVGILVFEVPFRGSVLMLAASVCAFLTGALFWGILISAIARNQLLAFQMGLVSSFLPAFLLSGFVFAIESMPPVVQAISHIVPARYFVTILKGVFLKGVGMEVLWTQFMLLTVFAVIVFLAATRRLKRKMA
ncbi:MAG: ABC transporter permease [Bryobacterales bacterium]|nr:ABC transporter permease [Bryobacterales bacterium]